MGNKYAAVLPEPVLARARTSLPAKASGIALICTGVGFSKFCFAIPCRSRESRPRFSNVAFGFVADVSVVVVGTGTSFESNLRFIFAMVVS